jgi:hypothetical protein
MYMVLLNTLDIFTSEGYILPVSGLNVYFPEYECSLLCLTRGLTAEYNSSDSKDDQVKVILKILNEFTQHFICPLQLA